MTSWESTTLSDVQTAIAGTPPGEIVAYLEQLQKPAIYMPIRLINALVLTGAAAIQDRFAESTVSVREEGHERLKLRINTMSGSSTQMYGLVIAPSCCGKECGYIPLKAAKNLDMYIGNSGTMEGLLDEIQNNGNGILFLSEAESLFSRNGDYRGKVAGQLTEQWNYGHFKIVLATKERESPFSFPSIVANIQPEVFAATAKEYHKSGGFLGRCLIAITDDFSIKAPSDYITPTPVIKILERYMKLEGQIKVPAGWLDPLRNEINTVRLHSSCARLVNEYGAKFAALLSCSANPAPEYWDRAEVLVKWFLSQQQTAFGLIGKVSTTTEDKADYLQRKILFRFKWLAEKHPEIKRTIRNLKTYEPSLMKYGMDPEKQVLVLVDAGYLNEIQAGQTTTFNWVRDL